MLRIKSLFLFLTLSLLLASCKEGKLADAPDANKSLQINSKTILDYSSTSISVEFQGTVTQGDFLEVDILEFYTDSACSQAVGSSQVKDFSSEGVTLDLDLSREYEIYLSTRSSDSCVFLENYSINNLKPSEPSLDRVSPPSPTRISTTPGVYGETFPSSSRVIFYHEETCTNPVTSDSSQRFQNSGIVVPVNSNATTPIFAKTEDQLNQSSDCVKLIDYVHSAALSDPPLLTEISPRSPDRRSTTPTITGTTADDATSISLFSDSGCTSPLASGSPEDFENTGFEIEVAPNSTVSIYAKSLNDDNEPSVCNRLGQYTHDDISPADPTYSSIAPESPTNQTTSPQITGSSSEDTATVSFYQDFTCTTLIGTGDKQSFESEGVTVGVENNAITEIYARAFDSAENQSNCVLFTSYKHNTIPPEAPIFQTFNPTSPTNASTTPDIIGTPSDRTVAIDFYDDESCSNSIGAGTSEDFSGDGIQLTTQENATTNIYATASDIEGNISECYSLASFSHSNVKAPDPEFFNAFPRSPNNNSTTPIFVGTADSSISEVSLFSDDTCSTLLKTGTRAQFTSSGISVNLQANHINEVYAKALDEFGNDSDCVYLSDYIHTDQAPINPTFADITPASPNNSSITPTLFGQSLQNPASVIGPHRVSFYDSASCVSKLGEGSPEEFQSTGISINVPQNAETLIFAKSFDQAGNSTDCVFMTDYIHDSLVPAAPNYLSSTPGSPSFSPQLSISGFYGSSQDFLERVNLSVYSDSSCSQLIRSDDPSLFTTTGFPLAVPLNQTTEIYAQSTNEVGTVSSCNRMRSFRHYDEPVTNLSLLQRTNGAVYINWIPDIVSQPTPSYTLERASQSEGPFVVIASTVRNNNFEDVNVEEDKTYYYRVYSTNETGRSQYTETQSITINSSDTVEAANLNAKPENRQVYLTWNGFPQNMEYKVYRSNTANGPINEHVHTTRDAFYYDRNLTNGETYYYIIKANNPSGESMQSNVASAVPNFRPSVPTNFDLELSRNADGCSGASGIRATWNNQDYFDAFEILQSDSKNSTQPHTTLADNTYLFCNPTTELKYYSVRAIWGSQKTGQSNIVGFYPSDQIDFEAHPGQSEVVLTWERPEKPDEFDQRTVYFDLYQGLDANKNFELLLDGVEDTSYVHNITNNEGRFYYIQSYLLDNAGDKVYLGYPTQIKSAITHNNPEAPTNLTLTKNKTFPEGFSLSWSAPSHYNGFEVYTSTSEEGPYTRAGYVTQPLFNMTFAPANGRHYYKVLTVWGSFGSDYSNTVSFRSAPIRNFTVQTNTESVILNWNDIDDIQDYVIYRSETKSGPYDTSFVVTESQYTDSDIIAGVGYYYKVKARFVDGTEGVTSPPMAAVTSDATHPAGLSLTAPPTGGVQADWTPVSGATSYQILRSDSLDGSYQVIGTSGLNRYLIFGLTYGNEHFIKIRAVVGTEFFESEVASIYTYSAPGPPTLTPGESQISLTWSPQTGAMSYDVLRSSDGVTFNEIVTGYTSTNYTDTSVTNSNLYFYKIKVHYPNNQTRLSALSIGATPGTIPLSPSNLVAKNNGSATEVELSWNKVTGVNRYNIYQSTSSGSYSTPILTTSVVTDVTIDGLSEGQKYYFTVRALNGSIESANSNEASIVAAPNPAKPAVEFLSVNEISISWSDVTGADSYDLYRSEVGLYFDRIAEDLATPSFTDSTIDPLKTYIYKYLPKDSSDTELAFSNISDAITVSTKPLTPSNLIAREITSSEVVLDWTKVLNISSYEILRSQSTGTGYTVLASVDSNNTTFTDTNVSEGESYFYRVRAVNRYGRPSDHSNEIAVTLLAGPTDLSGVQNDDAAVLSWSSIPEAQSYSLYRSEVSGERHSFIANTTDLTYTDSSLSPDKNYYYVVRGVLSNDQETLKSNEVTMNLDGFMNLQVSIELTDTPLSSNNALSLLFDRTQTTYTPEDYDGVDSINLEIVAKNSDSTEKTIYLVDSNTDVVASLTIPAQTFEYNLFELNDINLNTSEDTYQLALDSTTFDKQLNVLSAKLNINQINATKTKLYFPLLSSDLSPSGDDQEVSILSTSDNTYQTFEEESQWFTRDTSKLSNIVDFNAWELEALVSTSQEASGSLILNNRTNDEDIVASNIVFDSSSIQVARAYLDEGMEHFSQNNEGDEYQLKLKCDYNCETGEVRVHKAGLWVKLNQLTKARLIKRVTQNHTTTEIDTVFDDRRTKIRPNLYRNPQFYFGAQVSSSETGNEISLLSHNESTGDDNLSEVSNTSIAIDAVGSIQKYTSSPFTPTAEQNYVLRGHAEFGELNIYSPYVQIDVSR